MPRAKTTHHRALPRFLTPGTGWRWLMLVCLLLVGGCADESSDSVTLALSAHDTTLDTLEKQFLPKSYWSKKVTLLKQQTANARAQFQAHNSKYRNKLLVRREDVIKAVETAKAQSTDIKAARQQATQLHRDELAQIREMARSAGKNLRVQLALLRKAEEFLDNAQ